MFIFLMFVCVGSGLVLNCVEIHSGWYYIRMGRENAALLLLTIKVIKIEVLNWILNSNADVFWRVDWLWIGNKDKISKQICAVAMRAKNVFTIYTRLILNKHILLSRVFCSTFLVSKTNKNKFYFSNLKAEIIGI